MRRLSLTEIFFIQAICYLLMWLWNDFVASVITVSFTVIALFVLIISLIAELLERSKVPCWYFYVMFLSFLTPLSIGAFFWVIKQGVFDWMKF
jgi:hypothetical protein